jgi:hypothetical protein
MHMLYRLSHTSGPRDKHLNGADSKVKISQSSLIAVCQVVRGDGSVAGVNREVGKPPEEMTFEFFK